MSWSARNAANCALLWATGPGQSSRGEDILPKGITPKAP